MGGSPFDGGAESTFRPEWRDCGNQVPCRRRIHSPEKRNFAKNRPELLNLHKTVQISEILDTNLEFLRKFLRRTSFSLDNMTEFDNGQNNLGLLETLPF